MKTKTWLAISVLIAAIVSLVGCSNSESSSSSDDGSTTLTVWAMGQEGENLPELTKKFEEENENINVEVQALPWDSAHDKILTAVASGEGPDVLQLGTSWMPEFANAGALLDLTDYVEDYPNLKNDNYFSGAVESTNYEGSIYGVPWYVETRALFYRKDLLAEVGYEAAPKTWDELKDAATKLADRGDEYYGIDIDQNDAIMPFMFAWQNGSEFITEDKSMNFDTKEFVGGIEYYTSFFEEGLAQTTEGMAIEQAFRDGIKPMFFGGPWMINIIEEQAPAIEGKWDVAQLPEKETNTSVMGGSNFTVFHNTENVEESLKFISYMTEVDTQIEWLEIQNTLPSRVEAWEDPIFNERPMISVFGNQMENSKAQPQVESWAKISQEMLDNLEKVIKGDADLDKQLEEFRAEAKEIANE